MLRTLSSAVLLLGLASTAVAQDLIFYPFAKGSGTSVLNLAPVLDQPRKLGDVALMADPGFGRRLRVLTRFDLRLTPPRPATTALPVMGPDVLVQTTDIAV